MVSHLQNLEAPRTEEYEAEAYSDIGPHVIIGLADEIW